MSGSRADALALVGGSLALDFANTSDAATEHLQLPRHLVDWAAHAGAVGAATSRRLRGALAREGEAVLQRGLELRGTIRRIGTAMARGEAPAAGDLRGLKEIARRQLASAELISTDRNYALDFTAAPAEAALLGPVAWSAIHLLQHGRLERLKQCPGPGCGWLFLDTSKGGARRWCDMATCGNRAKARRHRAG